MHLNWIFVWSLCGSFLFLSLLSDKISSSADSEHKCDPTAPMEIKAALLTNYNMRNKPNSTNNDNKELRYIHLTYILCLIHLIDFQSLTLIHIDFNECFYFFN